MQNTWLIIWCIPGVLLGPSKKTTIRFARNFGEAARVAAVQRITGTGGLSSEDTNRSVHLRTRRELEDILRERGVQVIEIRATEVIESGGLSFELVRSFVERRGP